MEIGKLLQVLITLLLIMDTIRGVNLWNIKYEATSADIDSSLVILHSLHSSKSL